MVATTRAQDRHGAPEHGPAGLQDAERCWIVDTPEGAVLHVGVCAIPMPRAKAELCMDDFRARGFIMLDFLRHFQMTSLIGTGAQANVYAALDLVTGNAVAIKVAQGAENMAALWTESRFLYELRRVDGVVAIQGVYEFNSKGARCLALVLERLDSSLAPFLAAPRDEDACRLVMRKLLTTVKAIHGQGVVHRDIKPANVLVTAGAAGLADEVVVKLADFGLAGRGPLNERCGTIGFAAPEVFEPDAVLTPAVDVFACGMVLRCLLLGPKATSHIRSSKGAVLPLPGSLSAECVSLLIGMCHPDPRKRWTVEFALACPWLARN